MTAEKLVAASHTTNIPVTLWSLPNPAPAMQVVVQALRDLGYQVTLKVGAPGGDFFGYVGNSRHKVQAAFVIWGADGFSGGDFIVPLFACSSFSANSTSNTNIAEFCDADTEALIRQAQQLESTSPVAANALWAQADQHITDSSPWISLANATSVDVVSKRVHNYLDNPILGVLFDQMWLT